MDHGEFGHTYTVLPPVRSGNAFEETIEHLLQAIKIGLFPLGKKLPPERELAEHLGVSRATLRDALGELGTAGFIEARRGRNGGTYVRDASGQGVPPTEVSIEECDDILVFRGVVEPAAAALAADAELSEGARRHLLSCLDESCAAAATAYRPLDSRLHIAIAELSGSASLTAAVARTRARVSGLLDQIPLLPTNLDHANEQHRSIAAAILEGDALRARTEMEDHLEGTASLLRGFLT